MKKITLGHRLQYGLYRTFESLLALFPVRWVFLFGATLGRLIFHLAPPLRRTVRRNLDFAFDQELTEKERHSLAKDVFGRTGGNLFTSLRLPFLPDHRLEASVTLTNKELLDQSVAQGKGTLLIIPHMGNWELLAQLVHLAKLDVEIATHYRPLNNPLLNQLIERRRARRGLKLFPKRTSSHTLCAFLRDNGILSILADQRIPSKGHLCAFFGRPTVCSPLPALLAKRTDATILGLHCRTLGPDHWELIFTECPARDSQACATNIEHAWRSSPADVFWFQDRWKLPKKFPLQGLARGPFPSADSISKPIRLIALHSPQCPPLPRPDFPFPNHLISWETQVADDYSHVDQSGDIPIDLLVTEDKCPRQSCAMDQLIP